MNSNVAHRTTVQLKYISGRFTSHCNKDVIFFVHKSDYGNQTVGDWLRQSAGRHFEDSQQGVALNSRGPEKDLKVKAVSPMSLGLRSERKGVGLGRMWQERQEARRRRSE